MEYIILKSSDPDALSNMVTHAIANDWRPQGGVCVVSTGMFIQYIQAVVRGK